MATHLCVCSSFLIRSNHPQSGPGTLVFGGKGLYCPPWLQQVKLEMFRLADGEWVAATVLKAKIHHQQLHFTTLRFLLDTTSLKIDSCVPNNHFRYFLPVQLLSRWRDGFLAPPTAPSSLTSVLPCLWFLSFFLEAVVNFYLPTLLLNVLNVLFLLSYLYFQVHFLILCLLLFKKNHILFVSWVKYSFL